MTQSISTQTVIMHLRDIKSAIENECYIDFYDAGHMALPNRFLIPRPSVFKKVLVTRWGRALALVIRRMWWLGLAVLFVDIFRYMFLRIRMRYSEPKNPELVFIHSEKYGADSMGAYSDLYEVVSVGAVILTSPIRGAITSSSREMSCLQLFTYRELLKCILRSVRVYGELVQVSNDPLFRLHLIRVWRATINCVLMDKLNALGVSTVVHSNHYDLNAVIIHQRFKGRIVMVQHGQVAPEFVPPCRILPPAKLYVLDAQAEQIFRSCIFRDAAAQIEVVPYRKRLIFAETEFEGFVVLVASRPGDIEAEMQFISALRLRGLDDVKVIVKPHPLLSDRMVYPRRFLTQNRVRIWEPLYCYPRPSVLVCGRSTMRTEFEAYNIPVLDVHMPNVVDTACELCIRMIRCQSGAGRTG